MKNRIYAVAAAVTLIVLSGSIFLTSCGPSLNRQTFARKDCLDCHTKFEQKYFSMKNVHPVAKEKKCESCHLRHGIVPKLILKGIGNQVCYACHSQEKLGLTKAHIHSVLKDGQCSLCHNSHASQYDHLLTAQGADLCFQCYPMEQFDMKVVHKRLQTG